jgi:predicted Zn-dependent protease
LRKFATIVLLAVFAAAAAMPVDAAQPGATPGTKRATRMATSVPMAPQAADNDQTLRAMHDELERSQARLSISGVEKAFYIEYRLLDLDVRAVTASFGSLVSSTTNRVRYMSVDVRVGDHHLDSSNFVSEDGFQGFLGQTGQVGIDRDYNSLRQDLWLATDQAFKSAVTAKSLKDAFLRSLTKPPEIDDFSHEAPTERIEPRLDADWTSRKWEDEARTSSAVLRNFPQIYGTRVNYYLVYATSYLMTSEGTSMRTSKSLAAIEAAVDTQADDGMPLHNFYSVYAARPADLPDPAATAKALAQTGTELMALRASPLVQDYTGPVLFDAPAAASVLAQVLAPSLSGARPPLSMMRRFDEIMESIGGRSEWTGRVNTRVLPPSVTLVDDPSAKEYQGQPLLGNYEVDDEGAKAQRVNLVQNGVLKDFLMSRRPGPDFQSSNGHARSALLSETKPLSSNLFFHANDGLSAADLRKKFMDACRDDGHEWCLEVKRMDNPALASIRQEDFSEFIGALAGGISSGARMPLLIYRIHVADGREELVRGGRIDGLTLRSLRNAVSIGADAAVYTYMQNPAGGFAGTALGAFGAAQGGIPSTIVAPSLLLDEVEVRGFHGEPRRVPLVPAPPLH